MMSIWNKIKSFFVKKKPVVVTKQPDSETAALIKFLELGMKEAEQGMVVTVDEYKNGKRPVAPKAPPPMRNASAVVNKGSTNNSTGENNLLTYAVLASTIDDSTNRTSSYSNSCSSSYSSDSSSSSSYSSCD